MVQELIIKIIIFIWISICAFLDWKTGEVSNWLTIPPLIGGFIYSVLEGKNSIIIFCISLIGLVILYYLNSMGGADVKILAALSGLWPIGFFFAMLGQGIWGLMVLLKKGKQTSFRAIPAMAVGLSLGFILFLGSYLI